MEIQRLDVNTLYAAILTACDSVITNRDKLNAINLFPVADGDTGDNMSSTAMAIINHSSAKPTLGETIQSLANSALMGARGNSGMIFSQFFNGLTETQLPSESIDIQTFAKLISKACHSVRSAILHPVEGTIITVMDAWSASINKLAQEIDCFKTLLKQTLVEVNQALQGTATTLPILKKAQVVDAGALGFYHFISGFTDYLFNPRATNINQIHLDDLQSHHESSPDGSPPKLRYCTEIMLSGESINRVLIAKQLEQFGDSIVSSGNERLCRFHVHCMQPSKVFDMLINEGTVTQAKAEDMLRQFEILHRRKYPVALVTDSSADIPQEILDNNQIHIIQLNMHIDEHHLLDRIGVHQNTFYNNLAKLRTYPKTSFPSTAIISKQISHLAAHYEHVLILPIAQALSGTHDAIVKATEDLPNVHVIDSCLASGALGLLVSHAAQLIHADLEINEIKKRLSLRIPKIHLVIYVEQFESLIRSGRVSKFSGKIAKLANLKPIIGLNKEGKTVLLDKAFSKTKALGKIVSYINSLQQTQELEQYGIVHAGVPENAIQFAELTTEAFGKQPSFIEPVSTAIGLHAGKGSIALTTMMK